MKHHEAFEKDMKADMDGIYDLKAFPENYEVKKKFGFKISGDDLEYINAAEKTRKFINFKDKEIEVEGVTLKCLSTDMTSKHMVVSIGSEHYPK